MKKRISLKEVNRRLWERYQFCYETVNDIVTWVSFTKETKTISFAGWKLEDEIISHAFLVLTENEELAPRYAKKMKLQEAMAYSKELRQLITESYT